jgi:ribulose-bisphosphate carboxylase large chain
MELYRTTKPEDHFSCKFFLMSKTTLKEAAEALAIGQSIGNPSVRSKYETPEMMQNHSAKVVIRDPSDLEKAKTGVVEIAWPYRNIDWYADGIAHLMCTVMGGQMDIDIIQQCHWIDIDVDKTKTGWKGPSYGLTGFREHVQSFDKPLLGTIVKPKTGLTPEILKDIVQQMVDGGVDFIKEDEIMSNPACLTLNQRIDIVQPILDRSKTVYCYCINSDPHTLMDKARTVSSRGGMGVHINFWSGMGAYKAIRDEDNGTFIHFQKSGDKVLTSKYNAYRIEWSVLCKLAGLIGCDTIHAGMYGGYMDMGYEELKNIQNVCLEQNMVPAFSCGMTKELIPGIREKFGNDWMANVGGAIHTHPSGIEVAVKELRAVIDNG